MVNFILGVIMKKIVTLISFLILISCFIHYGNIVIFAKSSNEKDNNNEQKEQIIDDKLKNNERIVDVVEVWIYDFPMADMQTLSTKQVLAIKNRNPLNVKTIAVGKPWLGQISTDSQGHAIFSTFSYGLRAAALTIKNYATHHNINTVAGIINRFTEGEYYQLADYITYVSSKLGVAPMQKINVKTKLPLLLRHMAKYECGLDLPESLFAPYDILSEM